MELTLHCKPVSICCLNIQSLEMLIFSDVVREVKDLRTIVLTQHIFFGGRILLITF